MISIRIIFLKKEQEMSDINAYLKLADAASGGSVSGAFGAMMGVIIAMLVVVGIIYVLLVIGWWKVFTKCGKEGWAAIIPVYNFVVMAQICELPTWYVILLFVPIAQFYVLWKFAEGFTKIFGKDDGFKFLLFFLPFVGYPMLGFGSDMPQTIDPLTGMPMDNAMGMNGMGMNPMGPAPMGPAPMGAAPMGTPSMQPQPQPFIQPQPVMQQPVAPVAPQPVMQQPVAPAAPVAPVAPAAPVAPVAPAAPVAPQPVAPQAPVTPQDPTMPQGGQPFGA